MGRHSRSWKQLLEYMDRGSDERSALFTHNLKGDSILEWVQEFRQNERSRLSNRKDNVRVFHEVISFGTEDGARLDDAMLEDLVKEYVQLRAERALVVAIGHRDTETIHVHLAISGVEYMTGKGMRVSKQRFAAIKRELQNYQLQRYPELEHSIVQHGKKIRERKNTREEAMRRRTGQPSKRELVTMELRQLFNSSGSIERFEQKIREQGMEFYQRNGRPQGVLAGGIKYRLTTLGITKEQITSIELAPVRTEQLSRMRQRGRESERDEPTVERTGKEKEGFTEIANL